MSADKRGIPAGTRDRAARLLVGIAAITGVLAVVVGISLVFTYAGLQKVRPLDNPVIEALVVRLKADPGDDNLRQAIRELDLQARSACFLYRTRISTGLVLLAISTAVFTAALASALVLSAPGRRPGQGDAGGRLFTQARSARLHLPVLGIVLVIAAAVLRAAFPVLPLPGRSEPTLTPDLPTPALPGADLLKANWIGFRGWHGLGNADERDLRFAFDGETGEGITWKVPVPKPGYNSPIVWDDRVFLSGADAAERAVFCFDAGTGALIWSHLVTGVPGSPAVSPKVSDDTGYAAATMATDGVRVYAVFANGDLVGVRMDGTRVWARSLGMPDNHYGHSSSLIVYESTLFVQYDHNAASTLFAVDGATGDFRWQIDRQAEISWSSPVLVPDGGCMLLVLASSADVRAYDPEDGTELWRNACLSGEVAPSPAAAEGLVFVTNEGAGLTAINAATGITAWNDDRNFDYPDVASPVAAGQYLYLAPGTGNVFCIDPRTGTGVWEHANDYAFYASPLAVGSHIILLDRTGHLTVFKDAGRFELEAQSRLGEDAVATPAVAGHTLYIRGVQHLFAIGLKSSTP